MKNDEQEIGKTPRTDAAAALVKYAVVGEQYEVVTAEFARTLEIERNTYAKAAETLALKNAALQTARPEENAVLRAARKVLLFSAESKSVNGTYIVNDDAMCELRRAVDTPRPEAAGYEWVECSGPPVPGPIDSYATEGQLLKCRDGTWFRLTYPVPPLPERRRSPPLRKEPT